jgi:peptide/nickel transport system permease protein
LFGFLGILAPLIAPYDPDEQELDYVSNPPTRTHWLGTDNLGRDILSRVLFGARISLTIGFLATGIGMAIGGGIGVIAGFWGGRLDNATMRAIEVLMAFPGILLALLVIGILGPGLYNLMLAVGVSAIPRFARIVRAGVLQTKVQDYVDAARAVGAADFWILRRHVLPNSMGPVIVQASLLVATSILTGASLSFLGLGPKPPTAEWGVMLSEARTYLYVAPHMTLFPGLAILLATLGFNLAGDALRDALDIRVTIDR